MTDERKLKRVETLLTIDLGAEQVARQALDFARGQADELLSRQEQLRRALSERHGLARRRLMETGRADFADSYREGISQLRRRMGHLASQRKAVDEQLDLRRAQLSAAMKRRKSVEILRDRLRSCRIRAEARVETRQLDEVHAATRAQSVGRWAQDSLDIERSGT